MGARQSEGGGGRTEDHQVSGRIEWIASTPDHKRGAWSVACPPHVMTRLKRVFERISKGDMGQAFLADNPENCRELTWFLERFPMEMSAQASSRLTAGAEAHRLTQERVQAILDGREIADNCLEMALPAREYQKLAADLVATTGRLLLADDLGLGKTISAIAAIASSGKLPALVVTLTHLPRQWHRELQRFLPGVRVHVLKKGTPYPVQADVLISNYHKLGGWAETLSGEIKTVIFDEIQELRRHESKAGEPTVKYRAAAHIARGAEIRLGLSATPIHNYGGEMYNVLDIIEEGCLGTRQEFTREHCHGHDNKICLNDPKAFSLHLRDSGLMLRRTRAEVGRELASLTTIPYEIDSDKRALEKVGGVASELAKIILSNDPLKAGDKFRAGGELDSKIRQATGLSKASFVADFVKMLLDDGEKVVLFGWHMAVYGIWASLFKEHRPAFYTGKETQRQKDEAVKRFTSGETDLIILSLRSGAGLDGLQHCCRTVVFGEFDWSPAVHSQCIGRVHRDGQQDKVCAYFPHTNWGSDPIMLDVLGVKRGQLEGIINPDAPLIEQTADPDHIRKLAESILTQRGEKVPEKPKPVQVNLPVSTPTPSKIFGSRKRPATQLDMFGEIA